MRKERLFLSMIIMSIASMVMYFTISIAYSFGPVNEFMEHILVSIAMVVSMVFASVTIKYVFVSIMK